MSLRDLMRRALEDPGAVSQLNDKIKKGSQGSVTGPFEQDGEKVALKMFDYTDRPDVKGAIKDFEREYQSLKVLTHPSIVRFIGFDHFPKDHKAYLRMAWASTELADIESGGAVDLGDVICHHDGLHSDRSKSFLPETFIWHVLFHLSAALALCHNGVQVNQEKVQAETNTGTVLEKVTQSPPAHLRALAARQPKITWITEKVTFSVKSSHEVIIHRDIKPRNVLVCDPLSNNFDERWRKFISLGDGDKLRLYPSILLGDFGLSAPLHVAKTVGIGTYGFTAPEVPKAYRSDRKPFEWKTSCDIFSLGATLWNLMSLQPPPDGFGDNDTLPGLPLHYSSDLRKLVLRCYSKTQHDRPTAIDILDSCLQKGYWHQTLVGPYGTLISSDFDASIQRSWRQCLQQLGLPIRSQGVSENPPALVDDVLAFTKLEQRDKYGEFALFIAGAYFVGWPVVSQIKSAPNWRSQGRGTIKRRLRTDADASDEDSDNEVINVHFFVPGEKINAAVIVEYLSRFVDRTARITSAQHPTDKTRTGFNVSAKRALNAMSIRDLINDSKDWDLENASREYRKSPYDYRESDTARRRAKRGPSEGATNRPQAPRVSRPERQYDQQHSYQTSKVSADKTSATEYRHPMYGTAVPPQYRSPSASDSAQKSQGSPYSMHIPSYGFQQPGRPARPSPPLPVSVQGPEDQQAPQLQVRVAQKQPPAKVPPKSPELLTRIEPKAVRDSPPTVTEPPPSTKSNSLEVDEVDRETVPKSLSANQFSYNPLLQATRKQEQDESIAVPAVETSKNVKGLVSIQTSASHSAAQARSTGQPPFNITRSQPTQSLSQTPVPPPPPTSSRAPPEPSSDTQPQPAISEATSTDGTKPWTMIFPPRKKRWSDMFKR